jgi:hypothetical protein
MNLVIFVEVLFIELFHFLERFHFYKDLNRFRPVYSAKDFLDVICVLVNPNLKIDESLWKLEFFLSQIFYFDYFI